MDKEKIIRKVIAKLNLKSLSDLQKIKGQLIPDVQKVYDEWDQDDEGYDEMLGHGGICQDIAEAISSKLSDLGFETGIQHAHIGDQHVWVIVQLQEGIYEVDINPHTYETGGGYNWKKIKDVTFDPDDIHIGRIDADPKKFEEYLEE